MIILTCLKAQNCNCGDNFAFMVQHIKKNYVGYNDKINLKTSKNFERFTDSLLKIANNTGSSNCIALCRTWLRFFKDGHMNITLNEANSKDALRTFFSKEESTTWHEGRLRAYMDKNKNQIDSIEGIWSNIAKTYKFGVVRDSLNQNEFIGFIILADGAIWIPQQVKFRIEKINEAYKFSSFFARDHSPYPARLYVNKDTMDLYEIGKFYKNDLPEKPLHDLNSPQFRKLDDNNCLLTIPSFKMEYKSETGNLLIKNDSIIKAINHLIIDLRNNTGGADEFEKILPYLYTNPIQTVGAQVLATDANIKDGYEKLLASLSLTEEDDKKDITRAINKLKIHRGELYLLYPVDTITYNKVFTNPSHISILINNASASASELFILQAKQSKKVKIYGTKSAGMANYVGRVTTQMPCNFFSLLYPPTRLLQARNDGIDPGIKPDIEIPDSVTDWIDFVKKYNH